MNLLVRLLYRLFNGNRLVSMETTSGLFVVVCGKTHEIKKLEHLLELKRLEHWKEVEHGAQDSEMAKET